MAFTPPTSVKTISETERKYISGYTPEQEEYILKQRRLLDERDLVTQPVTLQEFKDIIVPWFRIHRTEEFNLHPAKPTKEPKVPKVTKVPKEKKLTKAQIQTKMQAIVMQLAFGQPLTEEETLFYKQQTGG
jgi:hypothetical protein